MMGTRERLIAAVASMLLAFVLLPDVVERAWRVRQGRRLSAGPRGPRRSVRSCISAPSTWSPATTICCSWSASSSFSTGSRTSFSYVSLFTIGHSVTLLVGVLGGIHANPYLIDAIIGFSVVYKAFENMDGFRRFFGVQPNTRAAVLVFGLFHGFGLATKLQDFELSPKRPRRRTSSASTSASRSARAWR